MSATVHFLLGFAFILVTCSVRECASTWRQKRQVLEAMETPNEVEISLNKSIDISKEVEYAKTDAISVQLQQETDNNTNLSSRDNDAKPVLEKPFFVEDYNSSFHLPTQASREGYARSIGDGTDISKYISPEFHNKNNVYNFSLSPETLRFTNLHNELPKVTASTLDLRTKNTHDDLASSSDDFAKKFHDIQEGVKQNLQYIDHKFADADAEFKNSSDEEVDLSKVLDLSNENNDTQINLNYTKFKSIVDNNTVAKNKIHKETDVEAGENVDFMSSFNRSHAYEVPKNDKNKIPNDGAAFESLPQRDLQKFQPLFAEVISEEVLPFVYEKQNISSSKPLLQPTQNHKTLLSNNINTSHSEENSFNLQNAEKFNEEEVVKATASNISPTTTKAYITSPLTKIPNISKRGTIKYFNAITSLSDAFSSTTPIVLFPKRIINEVKENTTDSSVLENQINSVVLFKDNITDNDNSESKTILTTTQNISELFVDTTFTVFTETSTSTTVNISKKLNAFSDDSYLSSSSNGSFNSGYFTKFDDTELPLTSTITVDIETIGVASTENYVSTTENPALTETGFTSMQNDESTEIYTEPLLNDYITEVLSTTEAVFSTTDAPASETTFANYNTRASSGRELKTYISTVTTTDKNVNKLNSTFLTETSSSTIVGEYDTKINKSELIEGVTTISYLSNAIVNNHPSTTYKTEKLITNIKDNLGITTFKNTPVLTTPLSNTSIDSEDYNGEYGSEENSESDTNEQSAFHQRNLPPKEENSKTTTIIISTNNSLLEVDVELTTAGSLGSSENQNEEGNGGPIAAIIISCISAVCLVLLAGLLFMIRKRHKRFNYGQRCTPVSLDAYSVDNVSVYNSVRRKAALRASKRLYSNLAFDDPTSITHLLNFPALVMFANNAEGIEKEFEKIPQVTAQTTELPVGCEVKNRYANIIALPETRVYLTAIDGYATSDYINANYVTGPKDSKNYYIACQAPMENTVDDFWRMIWEQQSRVILMLTHLFENGIEKCTDYLPPSEVLDCHRLFGDYQVTLKKREVKEKYVISTLQLKNMVSNCWRKVIHLWYVDWPERGVPAEANSLIAFIIEARSHYKQSIDNAKLKENSNGSANNRSITSESSPVVVHCSPGTGRTGTVIACDIAIREFELLRQIDIPKTVYRIRRERATSVQTAKQYAFIYKVICVYATKLTGGVLDSL